VSPDFALYGSKTYVVVVPGRKPLRLLRGAARRSIGGIPNVLPGNPLGLRASEPLE
jgi:hypothetical protein